MKLIRRPHLHRSLALCILLGSAAASAQPQPGAPPTAVAEALFQQARDLFKQERYAEACPKFAESQRLNPKLGTLLNVAVCNEKLGKIATAWAAYTSAAAIARRDGQKERETFAREQMALLEKRLARVTLQVTAPEPGLTIRWDDQPLSGAALDTPFPVDPGKHLLSVTAPGKKPWSMAIEVPPDRAQVFPVPIPALERSPEPPPGKLPPGPIPTAPALSATAARSAPPPPPPSSDARILMYAGFGVGAAGLLVGAVAGGITLSQAGSIRDKCTNNKCSEAERGDIDSATTVANVSNAGFVIGALGLGAGVIGYVLSRPSGPEKKAAATVTPVIGPGVLGLRGSF